MNTEGDGGGVGGGIGGGVEGSVGRGVEGGVGVEGEYWWRWRGCKVMIEVMVVEGEM